jgi:SAM-dependent methyltransferase
MAADILIPAGARVAPSTARNREPILDVLRPHLATSARVLEIASGAGEHAVFVAAALPHITWRPTDRDPEALASIRAWRDASGLANLLEPVVLDVVDPATWPSEPVDAVVCINMIHISPWSATEGLMAGAASVLAPGGMLYLYGPFIEAGQPTAPSNIAFDESLKARDPAWGLRDLGEVAALADVRGMALESRIPMPANNLSVVFRRR